MSREYFVALAATGLRMPIGTDLVLHEHQDAEAIMRSGRRLGAVMAESAARYRAPLAIPLMDLRLEKADLLARIGAGGSDIDTFHFAEPPSEEVLALAEATKEAPFTERGQAHIDSIRYIAEQTGLLPVGMAIGPFSLMTKLMADPITAVAMAGTGMTGEESFEVLMAERCLQLARATVTRSLAAQIRAGAKAVIVCEPAANAVYLSPKQIARGSDIFERFVMEPHLAIKAQLDAAGVDLIFHDCGELIPEMVTAFGHGIHPVMLSLGSSRCLWEDAARVPKDVVLFGNLPTKNFYSDEAMSLEKVEAMTGELLTRMKETGQPFILGSECDVLHVPQAAATIRRKVDLMLTCSATPPSVQQEP